MKTQIVTCQRCWSRGPLIGGNCRNCGKPPIVTRGEIRPEAHARRSDPETSHEAARATPVNDLEGAALAALLTIGGRGTNTEIVDSSYLDWASITPRMRPLERRGYVRDTGETALPYEGRRGHRRRQIVWAITDAGRQHAQDLAQQKEQTA